MEDGRGRIKPFLSVAPFEITKGVLCLKHNKTQRRRQSRIKKVYFPPRSVRQNRTRSQVQRKLRWQKRVKRWREDLREYQQHIFKGIIMILITALVVYYLGIDPNQATQQLLNSLTELLNRLHG